MGVFVNAEQRTKDDVVGIKIIIDLKYRSLSGGEGNGG
jgi:hypothetical protein